MCVIYFRHRDSLHVFLLETAVFVKLCPTAFLVMTEKLIRIFWELPALVIKMIFNFNLCKTFL
jgi:hypothetical protein